MPPVTLRHAGCALAAGALTLTAAVALAQPPAPRTGPPTPVARPAFTAAGARAVVDSVATLLERLYPAADTGASIAAHVRARAARGAYASARDWTPFARLLTQDLQSVNGDTHLFVEVPTGPPPGSAPRAGQHGIERVERLDGNVGYLRMSHFLGRDEATRATEAALRYLATTDAVIIDLRNSRGGSGDLSNFIISHFTGADTVHSLTVHDRARHATTERWTLARVPGPRRPEVPLFVLTDDVTRSAAEDLAFVLQSMQRATLVGTRTAGAGRNNAVLPVGSGLVASVSVTRVMDPRTRREWERVGVRPDVATPPESALVMAHGLALSRLAERASDPARKQELTLIGESLTAARRPARATAASLDRWVGTYEGGQLVTRDGDHLVYQPRVAQPRVRLVPLVALGDGRFAAGSTRWAFETTATGTRLRVTTADGTTSEYARTSAAVAPPPR